MKIIKFGGKSLANGTGIQNVLDIIKTYITKNEEIAVVLSARGHTTDELLNILEKARLGKDYHQEWENLKAYQNLPDTNLDFNKEFTLLHNIFDGVKLLGDYSHKIKDLVLAQGELISVKTICHLLNKKGIKSLAVDSQELLITDSQHGQALVLEEASQKKTRAFFAALPENILPIVTGFIAADKEGNTTTLGRNGSNYSAALLAQYLDAEILINYTHVDGIYTANPDLVEDARIINQITYQEASELASFGTSILHAKTIIPLIEKNIPLQILNTFNAANKGTFISKESNHSGVKSISLKNQVSIINIEGKGILGEAGIDARIFNTLGKENINVGVVSQGSSERGVGFVVAYEDAENAVRSLREEFSHDIKTKDIGKIDAIHHISVISIVGQNLSGFSSAYQRLIKNDIEILLINNNISGNNISLVVNNRDANKAVHIIHSQIFGVAKKINIAIFGKGTVGSSLINQILKSQENILRRKETKLNIFAIIGSQKILLNKNGIQKSWAEDYENSGTPHQSIEQIINYANRHHLENLIAIDNTASSDFIANYIPLIENGFDMISSNKIANTIDFKFYNQLRKTLKEHQKQYLYETNVGAGLPLIDTIKLLHDSGENITRIKGVFSGSLSYIFNHFSEKDIAFDEIIKRAMTLGYTEPDPREDLSGNDVARKLLILARELDLENEFTDISIKNLIPEDLQDISLKDFLTKTDLLNAPFEKLKATQEKGHVLRYVGELSGDLQQSKGILEVDLVSVPRNSSLGQLSGSNSIFEIYTESYGDSPILIQGAGAGAEVTARGVFGDLLRIADKK